MPRTLVIDTATANCSAVLADGDTIIARFHETIGRGHAERLVPALAAFPNEGRAEAIWVNCGPGSFTGVRIGIAAARALSMAWGAQLSGYSTMALIAAMARDQRGTMSVSVAMTGGHGEYFIGEYGPDGAEVMAPRSADPLVASSALTAVLVAGDRAEDLVESRGFGEALTILPDAAAALLLPATQRMLAPDPIYGRAPDAQPSRPPLAQ